MWSLDIEGLTATVFSLLRPNMTLVCPCFHRDNSVHSVQLWEFSTSSAGPNSTGQGGTFLRPTPSMVVNKQWALNQYMFVK